MVGRPVRNFFKQRNRRQQLKRHIYVERLELRQMLNADNQTPTVTWNGGTTGSIVIADDQPHTFALADFGYFDADGDPLDHIRIESLPSTGELTLGGYQSVYPSDTIDFYSLGYGYLVYTPNAAAIESYSTSFTYKVSDGMAHSAVATLVLNVEITPNTPPVVTGSVHSMAAESSRRITVQDLGYSDVDLDAMDHLTIHALPSQGTLAWDGYYPVNVGAVIDFYSLDYGNLLYTPNPSATDSYSTTIAFSANDGQHDSAPAMIAFNVDVVPNTRPAVAHMRLRSSQTKRFRLLILDILMLMVTLSTK